MSSPPDRREAIYAIEDRREVGDGVGAEDYGLSADFLQRPLCIGPLWLSWMRLYLLSACGKRGLDGRVKVTEVKRRKPSLQART